MSNLSKWLNLTKNLKVLRFYANFSNDRPRFWFQTKDMVLFTKNIKFLRFHKKYEKI